MELIDLKLTPEECDFIACLLYQAIGGDPKGLRRIGESIAEKIHDAHSQVNAMRFSVRIGRLSPENPSLIVEVTEKETSTDDDRS